VHLTACMLVRNEESIIEENIFFHRRMGVDRFLIMNHISTDNTLSILNRLKEEGVDIVVYEQNSPKYLQAEWMSFLSQEAHRLGTDWVIMIDADEFFLPKKPTIKDYLASVPECIDVIQCLWYNNFPVKGVTPFYLNTYFVPYLYMYKVIMRASPNSGVVMGNHAPTHTDRCVREHDALRVMHFQHRDKASVYGKYVLGGEALVNSNLPAGVGSHWRDGLEAFRKGKFEEFTDYFFHSEEEVQAVPRVIEDGTLKRLFQHRSNHTTKWLEITSMVGCTNRCTYCPQSLFTAKYHKMYLGTACTMSPEGLSSILDNVDPITTAIHFSGFNEIFAHPEGHELIAFTYERGFDIALFSTLVGLTEDKVAFLADRGVEFSWVRLHEFDGPKFNKEDFEAKAKLLRESVRINRFECQRVEHPISRGGSLWEPGYNNRGITCSRFDCNVVLPNGEVYLCCSDWGLRHYIGNLLTDHYDGDLFTSVRNSLREQGRTPGTDMLCKHCEMAVPI